jgi:hypothetical protein
LIIQKYEKQLPFRPNSDRKYKMKKYNTARFEVFTAVTMKNGVFWDVTRATRRNIPEDTILQNTANSSTYTL